MIERALILRNAINLFSIRFSLLFYTSTSLQNILNTDNQEELKIILLLLKPFYQLTIYLEDQARNRQLGAIWKTLPAIDLLLSYLEIVKDEY